MSRNKLALVPLLVSAILSLALFSLSFASSLSSDNVPANSPDRQGDLLVEIEPNSAYMTANPLPGTQAVVSGNVVTICSTPNVPIPDPGQVTDTISVDADLTILDFNVYINALHTWVGDMSFTLEHVDSGTMVTLIDRPGVPASTFGCSGDDYDVWVDDEGTDTPIENQCGNLPAITGRAIGGDPPDASLLTAFDGLSTLGDWTLTAIDNASAFSGTLVEWCVEVTFEEPQTNPAISLNKTVGTTPGVCAVTDEITVTPAPRSTTATWWRTQATSPSTSMTWWTASWATILNDFPYVLAPGAFSPEVIVPATPMATVTNVATWTALTALGDYIVDDTIPLNWEDISGTGTPVTLTDDSVSGALPIGFSFEFYGENYSDVYASSNGFITVLPGQPNGCCTGGILPSPTTPNGVIAGWWEDLNPSAGGTVHYQTLGTAPNRVFIVQYTDIPHFGGGNLVSKQYKLFEGSNIIEVHYLAAPSDGGTHSAGIENATGTLGIQYYRGTASLPTPLAVQYALTTVASASDTATATVNVLVQNIDVDPLSLSSTQPANTVTNQTLTIANTGDGTLIWNIAEEPTGQAAVTTGGSRAVVSEDASATDDGSRQHAAAAPELTGWRYPEAVLYDNGPLITHPGGGAGGADVSALQTAIGMDTFGFGHQLSAGNRVADDFTVTGGGWFVDTMTFFAYQTGSSTTSTINHINLRIWDGPPNDPGSSVVFGDTTTNRLVSSTWSNIYRTLDTALTDGTRPIMASTATVNTFLPAGTYWVDWQVGGTLASGPWAPPISILGQTTTGNALQWTGAWAPVVDGGIATPQGFPFIVEGLADCTDLVDVPWLSVSPTNGSNTGGTNTPVTATFDSTGLAAGTYTANLCVFSNDPDSGPGNGTNLVIVPVELEVEPFVPAPAIEIMKTVGTAPGVCAATSTITVPAGTTVYYCYTVMNTGNVTLNLHDLSDNELGPIFTGLSYALAPGESVNTVAAGLSIPAVINQPTTNTATWTAYNAGPSNVAIATATATVNVTYQLYLPIIVK
jgi:subtilisin-like proprotein convertase family protein